MKRYLLISAFLLFGFSCFGLGITLGSWICPVKSHKSDAIVEHPKTYQIAGSGNEGTARVWEGR